MIYVKYSFQYIHIISKFFADERLGWGFKELQLFLKSPDYLVQIPVDY